MKYIIDLSEDNMKMYSTDEWNLPLDLVDALAEAKPLPERYCRELFPENDEGEPIPFMFCPWCGSKY